MFLKVTCECGNQITVPEKTFEESYMCDACGQVIHPTEVDYHPIVQPLRVSRSELQCPTCGKEVSRYAVFCGSCGTQFKKPEDAMRPQRGGKLAVGSLIFGLVGWLIPFSTLWAVLGLVTGGIAMGRTLEDKERQTERRMAAAGMVVSVLLILVILVHIIMFPPGRISGRYYLPGTFSGIRQLFHIAAGTGLGGPRLLPRPPSVRTGGTAQLICANNLKQMGIVFKMYANENGGRFPPIDDWYGNLMFEKNVIYPEYLADLSVLRCPGPSRQTRIQPGSVGDYS